MNLHRSEQKGKDFRASDFSSSETARGRRQVGHLRRCWDFDGFGLAGFWCFMRVSREIPKEALPSIVAIAFDR